MSRIRFGDFTAVKPQRCASTTANSSRFLGPSGCGKTTILRTISGFLEPSEGKVRIGGKDMAGFGPNKRPTALIFQNLALFPLMSVTDNIGYGLRVRGVFARRARREGGRAAVADRPARPGQEAGQRIVGRPEAARRHRPRARRGTAGAAARRAAVGARSQAAPAYAQRAARHPAAGRHHLHLHHPRSGRGADHVATASP